MESNKNYNSPFAIRLRELFDETGVSQQEVADFIGISRQAIAQWKDGNTIPDMNNFKKVSEFFEVPYEYLLGDTDSRVRENMTVTNELGLSDEAISTLKYFKSISDENSEYAPLSDIVSEILASRKFEQSLKYLQQAIVEHRNHQQYIEGSIGTDDDIFGIGRDEKELAASYGKSLLDADKTAVFCIYQSVEEFRKSVDTMPEDRFNQSIGIGKPKE